MWASYTVFIAPVQINDYRKVKRMLKEEGPEDRSSPIIELGSGGWPFYKIYNGDRPQVCIDFDPVLVKRNKRTSGFFRNPFGKNERDVLFIVADKDMLPLRDGIAGAIVEVNTPESREKELKRVLRDDGVVIISSYGARSVFRKEPHKELVRVKGRGALS